MLRLLLLDLLTCDLGRHASSADLMPLRLTLMPFFPRFEGNIRLHSERMYARHLRLPPWPWRVMNKSPAARRATANAKMRCVPREGLACQPPCTPSSIYSLQFKWALSLSFSLTLSLSLSRGAQSKAKLVISRGCYAKTHEICGPSSGFSCRRGNASQSRAQCSTLKNPESQTVALKRRPTQQYFNPDHTSLRGFSHGGVFMYYFRAK